MRYATFLLLFLIGPLHAQYVPPDRFLEDYSYTVGYWENKGQVIDTDGELAKDVKFYSEGAVPRAYLRTKSRVSFVLADVDTSIASVDTLYRLDMVPFGPSVRDVDPVGITQKDWHQNFYLPHCGPMGVTNVVGYSRVTYPDIFPMIDLHFYSGSRGQKLAFVLRPGCTPSHLRLAFSGQDSLDVDLWGNLKVYRNGKFFDMPFAMAYQVGSGGQVIPINWIATYDVVNDVVGFDYSTYDPSLPLVFQVGLPASGGPAQTEGVCWSSYLGGDGEDQVFGSDVDADGNYYVSGRTYTQSINFPVIDGMVTTQSSPKAFLTKFNEAHQVQWSDLYGCSFGDQHAYCVATSEQGSFPTSVFMGGFVSMSGLHQAIPNDAAWYDFAQSGGGFLAEARRDNGHLIWSTYFGGPSSAVHNMDFDGLGRLVLTGKNLGDLPAHTVPLPVGAEQWPFTPFYQDGSLQADAFVAVLTTARQILWSTYIGGQGNDLGYSVRCSGDRIVVTGYTHSPDLPTYDPGGGAHFVDDLLGSSDVFLMEFDLNGNQTWGTYSGYRVWAELQGLAVDRTNSDVFLVGRTASPDVPVTVGAPWYDDTSLSFSSGVLFQFSGLDRSIKYATYISGTGVVEPRTVVVAPDGYFYVGGITWDQQFPIKVAPGLYSASALLGIQQGDGFIMAFTPGHALAWSTYFGGNETGTFNAGDCIRTLAIGNSGKLYAAGYTAAAYDQGMFFPLHDPGNGAWADQTLTPHMDGFVAGFCVQDVFTGVAEAAPQAPLVVVPVGTGIFQVQGVDVRARNYQVFDGMGRVVAAGQFGASDRIDLSSMSAGVYVLRVPGSAGVRIPVLKP